MIQPTSTNFRPSFTTRSRAFTALEALVMLVALFVLTMLGIGLYLKKQKGNVKLEQPTPANASEFIKPISVQPNKEIKTENLK